MFPMTVTISNPAQLNAVMAALGVAIAVPDPEKAQAEVAQNTASSKLISSAEAVVEKPAPAPEAPTPEAAGAADVAVTYQATADAVTKLARTKGREAAVAVLKTFGATKLPDVKPEQFAAVIAACEAAGA